MAKQKTKPTEYNVDQYIAEIPNEKKQADSLVILELMKRITGLEPKMWGSSIIGFGDYHYQYESGHQGDAPLLCFAPRKQKLVLYILTNFPEQEVLLQQLGKYKTGKICLYLNKLADVDLEILEKMIVAAWIHAQDKLR